jgi:RNA polymerase sigma-70 factor (ECF subfamily)
MDGLEAAIHRLHRKAASIWSPVLLDLKTFSAQVATCLAAVHGLSDPVAALETLHGTDLYLACAAGHGVPAAVEAFVRGYLQPISGSVQAVPGAAALVDEVRQRLHERLLVGTGGPPRILSYGGRSSLATWVGVSAQRIALDLLRAESAGRRAATQASEQPLPLDLDPELQYLKERYREDFKMALSVAIARLPQRERTVVRLHAVGGLTLAKIGSLLEVDESTVCRWFQRAKQTILVETQRELGARLGVQVSEVPSLARLVTSQLDLSLARLLGKEDQS